MVDDESIVRCSVARILVQAGYECDEASSSADATALLATCDAYEAALCDIRMPGESGLDLARRLVADHPDIAIVMMTGQDDPRIASTAFEIGAFGYVTKPFTSNEILIALSGALRRRELEHLRTARNRSGGREITRSRALTGLVNEIECQGDAEAMDSVEMIERLSRAVSLRDEETGRHIERMSRYAACLAVRVGFSGLTPEEFRLAAALHDVGKIGVADTILLKPSWLEPDELAAMRRHPTIGYRLLAGSTGPVMKAAAQIALSHHEWWDGTGYPRGLCGEAIPEEARIAAVADVFDALTSERVYKPPLCLGEATEIMMSLRGRQFEPRLIDAFFECLDEIRAIRLQYPDEDPEERVRVFIVDDHEIFVESLGRLLASHSNVRLVGSARTSAEAVEAVQAYAPDVILMDFDLPDGNGVETTETIKAIMPDVKVVMLTSWSDHETLLRAVTAGCSGFVSKGESGETLMAAIVAAHQGEIPEKFIELRGVLGRLGRTNRGIGSDLGPREIEVLELMAAGATNKVLASELCISVNTVRNHVQNIFYKLDAHSKLEAVATAIQEGILARTATGLHRR
ncbi:MAG: response regulator [Acidimicrobiales bacterium]